MHFFRKWTRRLRLRDKKAATSTTELESPSTRITGCQSPSQEGWNNVFPFEVDSVYDNTTSRAHETSQNSLLSNTEPKSPVKSAAVHQPQSVSFLDLPGELRNEIYHYALRHDGIKRMKYQRKDFVVRGVRVKEHSLAIMRAVPLLSDEVLSVYYSENIFRFSLLQRAGVLAFYSWIEKHARFLIKLKGVRLVQRLWPYGTSSTDIQLEKGGQGVSVVSTYQPAYFACRCKMRDQVTRRCERAKAEGLKRGVEFDFELGLVVDMALDFCWAMELDSDEIKHSIEALTGRNKCDVCEGHLWKFASI